MGTELESAQIARDLAREAGPFIAGMAALFILLIIFMSAMAMALIKTWKAIVPLPVNQEVVPSLLDILRQQSANGALLHESLERLAALQRETRDAVDQHAAWVKNTYDRRKRGVQPDPNESTSYSGGAE